MLTLQEGIIQNDRIFGIPFERRIVTDSGRRNVRPGIPLTAPQGLTNHNTGNPNPGADARAHAAWLQNVANSDSAEISVHFFVDAERIVQTVPINEVTWHAGDGRGPGNMRTISIEICETAPYEAAENNAIALNAAFLIDHPDWRIYKHEDWSGKYCPRLILARGGWADFVAAIHAKARAESRTTARDNNPSPWAMDAISWALRNKLIAGTPDGDLHLHRAATREEVITFLHRLHGGAQ